MVIGRHGSYNYTTKRLSPDGQEQARGIASQLGNYLGQLCAPDTTLIISSLAPRAIEFAEIIAGELRLGSVTNDSALGDADGKTGGTNYMINLLRDYLDRRALVLITHQESSWFLSTALFKDRLNDINPLNEGKALGFDTGNREVILFQ